MKIYLDILFLINFAMDFLLIKITADIMSAKIRTWRALLAAALGGVLGVCFFIPDLNFTGAFLNSAIDGAFIVFAAFWPCGAKEFIKKLIVMYIVSALFAGAMFFDMMMFGGGIIKNGFFYYGAWRTLAVGAVVYGGVRLFASKLKRRASQKISGVVLEYGGRRFNAEAFTDTGNGLFDPVSKKPVMLIEEDILKKLICSECRVNNLCEWVESEKIKVIPYHTIDGGGIMTGIVLDRIYIDGRCVEKAIAAVCEKNLKYPVILHAGM